MFGKHLTPGAKMFPGFFRADPVFSGPAKHAGGRYYKKTLKNIKIFSEVLLFLSLFYAIMPPYIVNVYETTFTHFKEGL